MNPKTKANVEPNAKNKVRNKMNIFFSCIALLILTIPSGGFAESKTPLAIAGADTFQQVVAAYENAFVPDIHHFPHLQIWKGSTFYYQQSLDGQVQISEGVPPDLCLGITDPRPILDVEARGTFFSNWLKQDYNIWANIVSAELSRSVDLYRLLATRSSLSFNHIDPRTHQRRRWQFRQYKDTFVGISLAENGKCSLIAAGVQPTPIRGICQVAYFFDRKF